jgi:hypothetical protein
LRSGSISDQNPSVEGSTSAAYPRGTSTKGLIYATFALLVNLRPERHPEYEVYKVAIEARTYRK